MGSNVLKIKPKERYESMVRKYPEFVRGAEKLLKGITFLFPMRYGPDSVNPEALSTLAEILPLYHDRILNESTQIMLNCGPETLFVKNVKLTLEIVKRSQLLVELLLLYRSTKIRRWNVIIAIELIKSLCRCFLVIHAKGRMLVMPEDCAPDKLSKIDALDPEDPFNDLREMYIHHERTASTPSGRFSEHTRHMLTEVEIPQKDRRKTFADLLFFLRPFIYVFMLKHRKWPALVVSLAMDIISILVHYFTPQTTAERSELLRRVSFLVFYLFRPPIYNYFMRDKLLAIFLRLASIPVIGFLGSLVVDVIKEGLPYFYVCGN